MKRKQNPGVETSDSNRKIQKILQPVNINTNIPQSIEELRARQPRKPRATSTRAQQNPNLIAQNNIRQNSHVDIDEINSKDPIYCATYAKDIVNCLLGAEENTRDYIFSKFQGDINQKMRMILIDWIVEVAEQYNVSSKALFLSKKIIDITLGKLVFTRNELQLLGVVALLISSKFEDVATPSISELVYISDNSCSSSEIKDMEVKVLELLDYSLTIPTEIDFLPRYLTAACHSFDDETLLRISHLAHYFSETTLLHYNYIKYKSSTIAIVCVCLALATSGLTSWNDTIAHYSPLSLHDPSLTQCMRELLKDLKNSSPDSAVRKKYSQDQFMKVAESPLPDSVPQFNV